MNKAIVVKGASDDVKVWLQFNTNINNEMYPSCKVYQQVLLKIVSLTLSRESSSLVIDANYGINENGVLQLVLGFHDYSTPHSIRDLLAVILADICVAVNRVGDDTSYGRKLVQSACAVLCNESMVTNWRERFMEQTRHYDALKSAQDWSSIRHEFFCEYYLKRVFSADNCWTVAFVPENGINSSIDANLLTGVIKDNLFDCEVDFHSVTYAPLNHLLFTIKSHNQPLLILQTWLQRRAKLSIDLYAVALVVQEYLELSVSNRDDNNKCCLDAKLAYSGGVLRLEYQSCTHGATLERHRLLEHRQGLDKLVNLFDVPTWEQAYSNVMGRVSGRLSHSDPVQLITKNPLGWAMDGHTTADFEQMMLDVPKLVECIQQVSVTEAYALLFSFARSNSAVTVANNCISKRTLNLDSVKEATYILNSRNLDWGC